MLTLELLAQSRIAENLQAHQLRVTLATGSLLLLRPRRLAWCRLCLSRLGRVWVRILPRLPDVYS